ncbi:MAG: tetratricopeptide repeat protein, partial [Planctomycetota bacterium]
MRRLTYAWLWIACGAWAMTGFGCATSGGGSGTGTTRSSVGSSGGEVRITADQRVRAGQILKEAGQLDAALVEFNRALEVNPRS